MAPGGADRRLEKSYLSSAVDSINPWAANSRSTTPTPKDVPIQQQLAKGTGSVAGDHSTTHLYGCSAKSYPLDCPPIKVLWFHAVDIPKRKAKYATSKPVAGPKPPQQPKKFVHFSPSDSRAIEAAYQTLLEKSEHNKKKQGSRSTSPGPGQPETVAREDLSGAETDASDATSPKTSTNVPVNEDYLFDVNIEQRELSPVYWIGPVYEVRRGTWFYQEGSTLRPCEENLASQLEDGFLKIRPWLYPNPKVTQDDKKKDASGVPSVEVSADASTGSAKTAMPPAPGSALIPGPLGQPQSHRLFGTYMNSVATYQDSQTAWLSSDTMLSWVTSTMYERFSGGGYMSGVKLVRGWSDLAKNAETKSTADQRPVKPVGSETAANLDEKEQRRLKRRSAPPSTGPSRRDAGSDECRNDQQFHLQRQLSSLMGETGNAEEKDEAMRQQAEQEIQDDYTGLADETQGRDIEHLCLVTHGIGQLLGMKMESLNFVHDVNVMRKVMKTTYANSVDLRALNGELGSGFKNCRVQVLPVCWRHLLDFPKKREKRGERDLADTDNEEDEYPSLDDITIEGVTFARSLISDLALDVLLYQSAYREQISEIVLKESNRIHELFMRRNPAFKGKVHIMGHSLGSAIMFDILCRQKEATPASDRLTNPLRFWPAKDKPGSPKPSNDLQFEFEVEDFYCLGSPVGLFQMLKGRTVSARHLTNAPPAESPLDPDAVDDPFLSVRTGSSAGERLSRVTGLPVSVSSPKVAQLYNIFHPSDPISYRLEPLISTSMSSLKPQVLPYTKKGIFGNVAQQGLTGIGAKVGQSVSGLWSSLSAGIASNILNRSLGLSNDDVAKMNSTSEQGRMAGNPAPGPASPEADAIANASKLGQKTSERKSQLAAPASGDARTSMSGNDLTLIDDELETLYTKYQEKYTHGVANEKDLAAEDRVEWEQKARKLRREDTKIRALNRNGRVDYSIQESVLDFNPINTIASHMGYWADEDVNHFILSQLLSSKTKSPRK
ncbi:hypothetical protein ACHAQH_008773 [Verticillium albo-atrum]